MTPEGESFLLDARRLVAECAQSVLAVQRLSRGEAGQLNIGYVANIYHDLLPATLGAFRKACPATALNLFDMTPAEQYHALEGRKIDLGFVPYRSHSNGSDLQSASVGQDNMMAAVAEGNPLAQKPSQRYLKLSDTATCKSSTNYVDDFGGKNLRGRCL